MSALLKKLATTEKVQIVQTKMMTLQMYCTHVQEASEDGKREWSLMNSNTGSSGTGATSAMPAQPFNSR